MPLMSDTDPKSAFLTHDLQRHAPGTRAAAVREAPSQIAASARSRRAYDAFYVILANARSSDASKSDQRATGMGNLPG